MDSRLTSTIDNLKPGDVLGFSSHDFCGFVVNAFTWGWPFWWPASWTGISHVGIVGGGMVGPAVWEATTLCKQPCLYAGEIVDGRMPDPVENHIAWRRPPDEHGLLVSVQAGKQGTVPQSAWSGAGQSPFSAVPSLDFADYLYSSGEYQQAAGEYLRVRFASGSTGIGGYAGLMAGESYLRAGDFARARHAFGVDCAALQIDDFRAVVDRYRGETGQ